MISVVIPTLNCESSLTATLASLVPAAVDGLVGEVIIADGGSTDRTRDVVDAAGAEFLEAPRGRGPQLRAGALRARFPWLLFLHGDTVLTGDWLLEAGRFVDGAGSSNGEAAAHFRFRLDDKGFGPRALERLVALRCGLLKLPYGDQGLLISRRLYDQAGGFSERAIMEDVEFVRRLGRHRIVALHADAVTSADRYRREGYLRRTIRNQTCLLSYFLGVPEGRIAAMYAGGRR